MPSSSSSSSKPGLVVTVKPSASAYFAGETFTATITFTNSHPPLDNNNHHPTSSHSRIPSTFTPASSWNPQRSTTSTSRNKPPNASHLGLAEYETSHLNSDEIHPPSPFFGSSTSSSGQFKPLSPSNSPKRRPQFSTSLSNSQPSSSSHSSTPNLNRTISSTTTTVDSSNATSIPIRRGLIGKPSPTPESTTATTLQRNLGPGPGGGLYTNGPRRPGGGNGLLRSSHGRTQSMASPTMMNNSSSPDLRSFSSGGGGENQDGVGRSASAGFSRTGHGRSRFGGSVVGNGNNGFEELRNRNGGTNSRGAPPPLIEESSSPQESTTPNYHEDAAFPISSSSSSPAPPSFPRRPTFGHQRVSSSSLYNLSRGGLSTLSLADSDDSDYDPNDDSQTLPANGFYGLGRNDTMDSVVHDHLNASTTSTSSRSRTGPLFPPPSNLHPRSISQGNPHLESSSQPSSFLHPPNTIALLWAFAHLEGSFEVDETLIKPSEFLEVKQLLVGGSGGVGVGGGTLEEGGKKDGRGGRSNGGGGGGGWRSWLWGSDDTTSKSDRDGLAGGGGIKSVEPVGGAATLEERKEKAVKDKEVPIFSCPPSILGVDLMLEPGESKSFSFTLRLPADLPPSFRGKAIKFNYQLVVGSNRVSLGSSAAALSNVKLAGGKGSISRVMRVPLRIYNHVGVTGARPFYDLTNPVIYQRDEATIASIEDSDDKKPTRRKRQNEDSGRPEFEAFASNLLASVALPPEIVPFGQQQSGGSHRNGSRSILDAPPSMRPEMSSHRREAAFGFDLDEGNGCKAAVEIVSRNSQKVSYDINKDGYLVAQLTLVKSAYRLGETVNGSVVVNSGQGRVLRVSARLETHELVETTISTKPAPQIRQLTRRLHSEHHEMTLDAARLGFALAIPSGATPDFGTSGVKLQWSVRMSFLVIPPSPDAPLDGSNPNLTPRRLPLGRTPPPPPPPQPPANGRSGHHGRSKSFAYGFEPAVTLTLPPPPSIAPTGAAHLMPIPTPPHTHSHSSFDPPKPIQYTSYRAVPDLGFVPVLFSSSIPDPPPAPGPLQKTAQGAMHRPNAPSLSLSLSQRGDPFGGGRTVLVPAKVETVECSIPIKVYPGNTPFKPTVTIFDA